MKNVNQAFCSGFLRNQSHKIITMAWNSTVNSECVLCSWCRLQTRPSTSLTLGKPTSQLLNLSSISLLHRHKCKLICNLLWTIGLKTTDLGSSSFTMDIFLRLAYVSGLQFAAWVIVQFSILSNTPANNWVFHTPTSFYWCPGTAMWYVGGILFEQHARLPLIGCEMCI